MIGSMLTDKGFVSCTALELLVLISPDRPFQSWIQLEVVAFMKKYGSMFSFRHKPRACTHTRTRLSSSILERYYKTDGSRIKNRSWQIMP